MLETPIKIAFIIGILLLFTSIILELMFNTPQKTLHKIYAIITLIIALLIF